VLFCICPSSWGQHPSTLIAGRNGKIRKREKRQWVACVGWRK
jgi:hypothetical protein